MAQITIGEGLWSTIRGYINSMFTEIYAAIATGGGNSSKYSQSISLTAGVITRVTTTLTTKPYSLTIMDTAGNIIPLGSLGGPVNGIQIHIIGGFYVLDIYSVDGPLDVEILITY